MTLSFQPKVQSLKSKVVLILLSTFNFQLLTLATGGSEG